MKSKKWKNNTFFIICVYVGAHILTVIGLDVNIFTNEEL